MPDSDLRPMLLMVCGRCRNGTHTERHTVFCEEPGCAFQGKARTKRGDLKPARTREEMIQAGAQALWDSLDVPDTQKRSRAVLIAAGVIEEEERDASV